jgi:hypothetical protein
VFKGRTQKKKKKKSENKENPNTVKAIVPGGIDLYRHQVAFRECDAGVGVGVAVAGRRPGARRAHELSESNDGDTGI